MATKINAPSRAFPHDAPARELVKRPLRPGSHIACAGLATLALASLGPTLANAQAMGGSNRPLTFGAQVVSTYDSNPARGSAGAAAIRGLQDDEIVVSPQLTVAYSHNVGLQGLTLSGAFGYDKHIKNSHLNAEHIDFSAAASRAVGARCSVNGEVTVNRGQSNLENVSVAVSKDVVTTYNLSGGESCATPTGITESVHVTHSASHNSDSTLVDFNTTGVSGSVGYENDVIGNVGLLVSYNKTSYVDIPTLSIATPNGVATTSVGVTLSRPFGARLSGNASVSYSTSHQDSRADELVASKSSYSGLTASAGLNYQLGPRLQLAAQLSRNITGSAYQNVGYAVDTDASLTGHYTVSSRISANLGGSWSRSSNRGVVDVVPLATLVTPEWQETAAVVGGVSVQVGRRAAVSLDLRHEKGSADIDLYEYSNNRVSLTLSTSL